MRRRQATDSGAHTRRFGLAWEPPEPGLERDPGLACARCGVLAAEVLNHLAGSLESMEPVERVLAAVSRAIGAPHDPELPL